MCLKTLVQLSTTSHLLNQLAFMKEPAKVMQPTQDDSKETIIQSPLPPEKKINLINLAS